MGTHVRERETCIPSRRQALRTIGVSGLVAAAPATALALATDPRPDAELIALGEEFDRLHAAWLPLHWRWAELELITSAAAEEFARQESGPAGWYRYEDVRRLAAMNGLDEACEANTRAADAVSEIAEKIRTTPARSFAGLHVKARAVLYHSFPPRRRDGIADNDMDWDVFCLVHFVREIAALAGEVRA